MNMQKRLELDQKSREKSTVRKMIIVITFSVFSLVLSGCGPGQIFGPTFTPTPTPTSTPTPTPTPTSTPTPTPTPTSTPTPTLTPTPTPYVPGTGLSAIKFVNTTQYQIEYNCWAIGIGTLPQYTGSILKEDIGYLEVIPGNYNCRAAVRDGMMLYQTQFLDGFYQPYHPDPLQSAGSIVTIEITGEQPRYITWEVVEVDQ